MIKKSKKQWLGALLLLGPLYSAHAAVLYTVTDLTPDLEFGFSQAVGINDAGQVAGNGHNAVGFGAFIAHNGTVNSLSPNFSATGINAGGQVSGVSGQASLIYSGGAIIPVNNGLGGSSITVTGINDSGLVTGVAGTPSNNGHAFIADSHSVQDLGVLPGGTQSSGYAINNLGQVTGESNTRIVTPSGIIEGSHAFVTENGLMRDLGTLGGAMSRGNAINDAGIVAGYAARADGSLHAFISSATGLREVGDLGAWSVASGINNAGQVVGRFGNASRTQERAFATINGEMTDLNTVIAINSGWLLLDATDINNSGYIVGTGVTPSGRIHAFLLTPVAVPLPAAVWLFGSALLGWTAKWRGKAIVKVLA